MAGFEYFHSAVTHAKVIDAVVVVDGWVDGGGQAKPEREGETETGYMNNKTGLLCLPQAVVKAYCHHRRHVLTPHSHMAFDWNYSVYLCIRLDSQPTSLC